MAELIQAVTSWPSVLGVLVVFGFAPGFCLRLIVLAYPRGDPRRDELIAELYAVPRIDRPLWVAEQLEVALFEGLAHRVSAALRRLTGRRRARTQTAERGGLVVAVELMVVVVIMFVSLVAGGLVGVLAGGPVFGIVCGFLGVIVGALVGRFLSMRVFELMDRFRSWRWPLC